ncbi:hypothetical protein CEXT_605041 [Caerostris extrusa]|uniref:Uncharacterized protein n=1 Tax=Caerostris extrusa TaxID=172846 RepID=A0AAV4YA77_CAEEX|nr:hypothetical protein CEXT_605041 [Caerostris extrusa]
MFLPCGNERECHLVVIRSRREEFGMKHGIIHSNWNIEKCVSSEKVEGFRRGKMLRLIRDGDYSVQERLSKCINAPGDNNSVLSKSKNLYAFMKDSVTLLRQKSPVVSLIEFSKSKYKLNNKTADGIPMPCTIFNLQRI